MALDSTTTLIEARAQLADNLSWDGSPTKANLALEAVRWLLFFSPQTSSSDGDSLGFVDYKSLEVKLQAYVDRVGAGAARRTSFTRGRPM